ncbi:Hypothetical protein, predicted transmembrane protein [Mycoplasma putrefaciens Mput9231]|uniref:Transmembrane protein n=1 Tax=Mycoplasma putrefaciens Mput9231 TaxID=1292033 RepID=M9WBX4_9MOLU|nr:Hypothetical protein, predicted transmembrane protein [Mycoplasma putrefaciens Mput9231]
MSSLRWDLYIVNPIIIILGLALTHFLFYKNKTSSKKKLFFLELALFWIASIFLIKINNDALVSLDDKNLSLPVMILLSLIGSYVIFLAVLSPLSVKLTFFLHRRRLWIWIANGSAILATILGFVIHPSAVSVIFMSILIGIAISAKTIYFLFYNEQFHERLFPILTSMKCGVWIVFSTFIAVEIYSLTLVNNHHFQSFGDAKIILIIALLALLTSLSISILLKENKQKIRRYDDILLDSLQKPDKKTLIWLMLIGFLIGLISALIRSPIFEMYIAAMIKSQDNINQNVLLVLRNHNLLFIGGQMIFGYLFYRFVLDSIGVVKAISLLTAIAMAGLIVMTFVHNVYLILVVSFIFGLLLFVTFYTWFGIALMWNYRVKKTPIIGIYISFACLGFLLPNTVTNILKSKSVALFAIFKNTDAIINATDAQQIKDFVVLNSNAYYVVCSTLFVVIASYLVAVVWLAPRIIAEYHDLATFKIKIATILRKNLEDKINTRLVIE